MSAVRFQDQLGDALHREAAGQFVYKPPDGIRANWRPADWLLCLAGRFLAIEAKQTRENAWPFRDWPPQQRGMCELVERSGGAYWVVINWRGPSGTKSPDTVTYAFKGSALLLAERVGGRKSVTPEMARQLGVLPVCWVPGKGWDVGPLLERYR